MLRVIKLKIDKFKIVKHLYFTVSNKFVLNSKPLPELFQIASQKLKLHINQALAVEDSYTGFDSAIKAQIPTSEAQQNWTHNFYYMVLIFGHLSENKFSKIKATFIPRPSEHPTNLL